MNLRGVIPLTIDKMKLGRWVWMTKDVAEIFSVPYQLADPSYQLPHGVYGITKIVPRTPDLRLPPSVRIACEVYVHHHKWIPGTDPGVNIVYNINSEAITIDQSILVSDALYPVFRNRKEFDEANQGRTSCISCGNPLNIFSVNLRICQPCEDIFDRPSPSKKEAD